jgi:seryl-tRNA synthetase
MSTSSSESQTDATVTEIHDSDSSSSSSESGEKVTSVKITKEFQENVIKYVKLDDLIKQKQGELSELKEQIKPCEQYIISSLESLNESSIGITNGTLVKKKVEKKAAINPDIIKAGLSKKLKDANAVEELLKLIEGERALTTKTDLKRTTARGPVKRARARKPTKN